MLNFNWQIPTKFIFGRGAESHAGEELKALGYTQQSLEALWEGGNDHA